MKDLMLISNPLDITIQKFNTPKKTTKSCHNGIYNPKNTYISYLQLLKKLSK